MTNQNIEIFSHEANSYHNFRIVPPKILLQMAQATLNGNSPKKVVDLGCGTGLSTQIWAAIAPEVIGIEPNEQMRLVSASYLQKKGLSGCITLMDGHGAATGLADDSVDLVACSQSLHWMPPEKTHPEIVRILRPGGALLAFGYTMPPTIRPEIELAYNAVLHTANRLIRERALWPQLKVWSFPDQLQAIQAAQWYRYVKEAFFHQSIDGTADWLLGLTANYGAVARALAKGVSSEELGIAALKKTAQNLLGRNSHTFLFHYKMLVAVK